MKDRLPKRATIYSNAQSFEDDLLAHAHQLPEQQADTQALDNSAPKQVDSDNIAIKKKGVNGSLEHPNPSERVLDDDEHSLLAKKAAAFANPECSRYEQISVSAYFRAEHRGFVPGHDLEDWLQAEREFDALVESWGVE